MGQFHFVKGSNFLHPETFEGKLKEGFTVNENQIAAQVSVEHIRNVMDNYLTLNKEADLFFFMEVPLNIAEEEVIQPATENELGIIRSSRHKVYYLDGIGSEVCSDILDIFGDVLINDGISAFGFGTYHSEIGKYKYNQILLYNNGDDIDYRKIFLQANISESKNLISAWDLFTEENPGVSERYEDAQGRTIYDIVDVLKKEGLYEADVRSDDSDEDVTLYGYDSAHRDDE